MMIKERNISNPVYERPLKKGHSLAIHNEDNGDVIKVRNAKGLVLFTIEVSTAGATLNIEAENICISAANKLNITGKEVHIASEKQLNLKSNGNLDQQVKGNKTITTDGDNIETAKTQQLNAYLGDIKLKANDDIKLNGERVKLNCD